MDLVALTEYLVKSLVTNPESVSVKQFDSDEEDTVFIQVMVESDQIAAVIGKSGNVANSIRTIVQASSYIHDNKRVKINIDSF